jgi:sugar/nucleoside kinase (ribokinase family)
MTSARPAPEVLTFGEAMAMFVADTPGSLDEVEHYTRSLAGAETNVATGLARLGHSTGWIGRVGDDPFGRFIHTALSSTGIDTAHVSIDPDAPTGFQIKSHAGGGDPEVVYFRKNSAGSRLSWDPALEGYIGATRHLHVTGIPLALSPSTREFAFRAVQVAKDHGVTVSFDTNLRPVLWASTREMIDVTHEMVALADIVLPGASEGQVLLGTSDPLEIGHRYLNMGASTVIVKDGGHGATVVTREEVLHRNVFPV